MLFRRAEIERISSDERDGEPIECQDSEIGFEVRDRKAHGTLL